MSANERIAEIFERIFDPGHRFIATSDVEHSFIHRGLGYVYMGNTGSLSAGSTYSIGWHTPIATAKRSIHSRPAIFASTANILLVSYNEGQAYSGGTAAFGVNCNRNMADAPNALYYGVTPSGSGTLIMQDVIGATNTSGTGGSKGMTNERVLRPDTDYVVTFNNISNGATTGYFTMFWYVYTE